MRNVNNPEESRRFENQLKTVLQKRPVRVEYSRAKLTKSVFDSNFEDRPGDERATV